MAEYFEYQVTRVKNVTVLVMNNHTAQLVADALEVVSPDADRAEETARALAAAITSSQ